MASVKTHVEESDILIIGGGMAGTGATFEARKDEAIIIKSQRKAR